MADFHQAIEEHKDLPEEQQKKAGQAAGTDMSAEHKKYLAGLIALLDTKEVDVTKPASFVKKDSYNALDELARGQLDLALVNMADQLRRIEWFFRSNTTPNASPELQTMIDHLKLMKDRIAEKYGDVLKF